MSTKQPPFVIHVSEMADFPDAVYIGRENGRKRLKRSKWANPYKIGGEYLWTNGPATRHDAVDGYRVRLTESCPSLLGQLPELTGKPLACWCRRSDEPRTDDNMCHGDVLVELWKEQVEP